VTALIAELLFSEKFQQWSRVPLSYRQWNQSDRQNV